MTHRTQISLSPLAVIALLAAPSLAAEATTKPEIRVEALLAAIQNDNTAAFVADATPAMKKAITPAVIHDLSQHIGVRLAKKHTLSYLGDVYQKGYTAHLFKLAFTDGGDDVIVRVVFADGKLAGFFLQ